MGKINEKINFRTHDAVYHEIDIKKLKEDFDEAYLYFYEEEGKGECVPGYEFLVMYFDTYQGFIGDFRDVLTAFYKERHDIISSDREAAAFVAALGKQLY